VQAVIEKRDHKEPPHKSPQALCGLLKCSCGMSITAEKKIERQKMATNTAIFITVVAAEAWHGLPWKRVARICVGWADGECFVQFRNAENRGNFMFSQLEKDELVTKNETDKAVAELRCSLDEINAKTKRLFDVYLDGDIDRENYRERHAELLMSEKQSFEYKIERVLTKSDF
jgi:hypothetical protein